MHQHNLIPKVLCSEWIPPLNWRIFANHLPHRVMCEDICSKTHEYKHRWSQNGVSPLKHTQWHKYKPFSTLLWAHSSTSRCEQRWVLVTYPPKHVAMFKNSPASKVNLPCVYEQGLCEWMSVCRPEPQCSRCHYTRFDSSHRFIWVSSRPKYSLSCVAYLACVPVSFYHTGFKTAAQLLSIFRATVKICQLNYQGTKYQDIISSDMTVCGVQELKVNFKKWFFCPLGGSRNKPWTELFLGYFKVVRK